MVPAWAKLQKKVDIILRFWKIYEIDDILVVDQLPCFYLIFQSVDEVLLG